MKCRHCHTVLEHVFVDLGHQPPSNAYLTREQLALPEVTLPLRVYVCHDCWLVQLPAHASASTLFTEHYAYFSSVSASWVEHARQYAQSICRRLRLSKQSFVLEVASNDGYLLDAFKQAGIPCLGIEPTASTARAAREKGIETVEEFFGQECARRLVSERGPVDLLIGNNVLAHVPELNDFVAGIAVAIGDRGVATLEFPHLLQLVKGVQFDTIYHEHYSYFSFYAVCKVFERHNLSIFDVDRLPTHGGSLRVYVASKDSNQPISKNVDALRGLEIENNVTSMDYYSSFQRRADCIKNELILWLIEREKAGDSVAAYGAAAKGNTLLNYAGVRADLLPFVCDAAESKQGKFLPGSHIPILPPSYLKDRKTTHLLLLPWNIQTELRRVISTLNTACKVTATAVPSLVETPL